MNRVRISRRADADVDGIADYIAKQNPSAADRVADELLEAFSILGQEPLLGESRHDLGADLRGFVVTPYLILYRALDDGVEVVRVIHGARDIKAVIEQEGLE